MAAVAVAPLIAVVDQLPTEVAAVVRPMAEAAVLTAIVKIEAFPKGPPFRGGPFFICSSLPIEKPAHNSLLHRVLNK
jgi:hypothetical protein